MINDIDVSLSPSGATGTMRVLVNGEDVGLVIRTDAGAWRSGGWDFPTQDAAAYAAALRRRPRRPDRAPKAGRP